MTWFLAVLFCLSGFSSNITILLATLFYLISVVLATKLIYQGSCKFESLIVGHFPVFLIRLFLGRGRWKTTQNNEICADICMNKYKIENMLLTKNGKVWNTIPYHLFR